MVLPVALSLVGSFLICRHTLFFLGFFLFFFFLGQIDTLLNRVE